MKIEILIFFSYLCFSYCKLEKGQNKQKYEGAEKQVEDYEGLAFKEDIERMGHPNDNIDYDDFGDKSIDEDDKTAEDEETAEEGGTAGYDKTAEDEVIEGSGIEEHFPAPRCQQVN